MEIPKTEEFYDAAGQKNQGEVEIMLASTWMVNSAILYDLWQVR